MPLKTATLRKSIGANKASHWRRICTLIPRRHAMPLMKNATPILMTNLEGRAH